MGTQALHTCEAHVQAIVTGDTAHCVARCVGWWCAPQGVCCVEQVLGILSFSWQRCRDHCRHMRSMGVALRVRTWLCCLPPCCLPACLPTCLKRYLARCSLITYLQQGGPEWCHGSTAAALFACATTVRSMLGCFRAEGNGVHAMRRAGCRLGGGVRVRIQHATWGAEAMVSNANAYF
jgi:hypothetical protein